jgi:hypothetical protein
VAFVRLAVVIAGGGQTSTGAEPFLVGSVTDVAVTVMMRSAATPEGALYVAEVAVTLVKVPHAEPTSPLPEQLQVTPCALESFSTVAANFIC